MDIPSIGLVQWFRFRKPEEVNATIRTLQELGVYELRTALSWADWERPGGPDWFSWFIDRFYRAGITIFPSLFYTPAGRALCLPGKSPADAKTCHAPSHPEDYADFCETIVQRYGEKLGDWYQVWNEPNNDAYWSREHDSGYGRFMEMAHLSIDVFQKHNKRVVLGGIIPPYLDWLSTMKRGGLLQRIDALGIHAFPGTWDKMEWRSWTHTISLVRVLLSRRQEVWVTETGFSTVTLGDQSADAQLFREKQQIRYFNETCRAPAEKIFWYSAKDQEFDHPTDNAIVRGTPCDPRAYYFGIKRRDGTKKPLFEYWKDRARGVPQRSAS